MLWFVGRHQRKIAALFDDDAEFHGPAEFGGCGPKARFEDPELRLSLFQLLPPLQGFGFDGLQSFFAIGGQVSTHAQVIEHNSFNGEP